MKRAVIVGSGFGGVQAATDLDHLFRNHPDVEILLISEQNNLLFTPLLPQIASSYTDPRHITQTVREIRGKRRFRFRRDTVSAIDTATRTLTLSSGSITYDALLLAPGSRTDFFNVPGAREFGWEYKSLQHAVELRERIIDICEHADHTPDEAERRSLLTFAVVGGGYTGIELVTEMHDFFFRYVVKKYRGIQPGEIRLVVLDALPDILGGIGPELAAHARSRLHSAKIDVRTSTRVTRVFDDGVEINGNERIDAQTIIWTAGVRATELIESLPGPHDRIGRAVVNAQLQLEGHPEIFVMGDSAVVGGGPDTPRIAPVAMEHAKVAARNVAHLWNNEPLESYRFISKGMLVTLGLNYAVVNVAGVQFSGYFAWLFWNSVHLYLLAGLRKQIEVATDWVLSAIFPRDASIVREPRRCKICDGTNKGSGPAETKSRAQSA